VPGGVLLLLGRHVREQKFGEQLGLFPSDDVAGRLVFFEASFGLCGWSHGCRCFLYFEINFVASFVNQNYD
jgi:hypothetical protein